MTQTHRFTEPTPVMDLLLGVRRCPTESDNWMTDEDYEAWLDERWADQWEIPE